MREQRSMISPKKHTDDATKWGKIYTNEKFNQVIEITKINQISKLEDKSFEVRKK